MVRVSLAISGQDLITSGVIFKRRRLILRLDVNSTGAVKFRRAIQVERMRRLVILRQAVILGCLVVSGVVGRGHVALRGRLADPQVALVGSCAREIVAARQPCSTTLEMLRYMVIAVVGWRKLIN